MNVISNRSVAIELLFTEITTLTGINQSIQVYFYSKERMIL